MEQKRRLWNKSDLYGTKATVMEQKRRFMEQKVHLWNRSASLSTLWNKQRNLWKKKIPAVGVGVSGGGITSTLISFRVLQDGEAAVNACL